MATEDLRINSIPEVGAPANVQEHQGSSPVPANVSLMGWVYFLLLDTCTTNQTSANIRAKQIDLNASVQNKLNDELMELGLIKIPTAQYKEQTSDDVHWDWKSWEAAIGVGNPQFSWHFWRKSHWQNAFPKHWLKYSTHKKMEVLQNQGAIIQGHSESSEQGLLRNIVTDKLANERQKSEGGQSLLGALTSGAMQGIQQGIYLLDQVKDMTFKILNRRVSQ